MLEVATVENGHPTETTKPMESRRIQVENVAGLMTCCRDAGKAIGALFCVDPGVCERRSDKKAHDEAVARKTLDQHAEKRLVCRSRRLKDHRWLDRRTDTCDIFDAM